MIDIYWTAAASTASFNEVSVDFRIVGEVPNTVDLYIAPVGIANIGGTEWYGGIQTHAGGWPTKTDHNIEPIDRGGIFSRWSADKKKIPLDFAEGPPGVHYESADYEDNFVSVRNKVDWHAGSYSYIVRRARSHPSDVSFVWFTAYIRNNATGVETEIGSLRFNGPKYDLYPTIAAFVEVYGSTSIIPQVTVAFSEPRVNGVYRPGTNANAIYDGNGTTGKPRYATSAKLGREIIVTLRPRGLADNKTEETYK